MEPNNLARFVFGRRLRFRAVRGDEFESSAQAQLARREREVVELNHRFANTLQILSASLLSDARRMEDAEAQSAFNAASSRVMSMARLHRQLAECRSQAGVDLYRLLLELARELESSVGLSCAFYGEPMTVNADVGFGIATIVTELVLNARKHAYDSAKGGHGPHYISLRRAPVAPDSFR